MLLFYLNLDQEFTVSPINTVEFDDQYQITQVGMDIFILGYPHGYISDPTIFPIWKKGTLAAEPDIDIGKLPQMYVDATTANGMSGAPVIAGRAGSDRGCVGRICNVSFWLGDC